MQCIYFPGCLQCPDMVFFMSQKHYRVMWDSMAVLQGGEQEGARTSSSSLPLGTFHSIGK